jgi:hypothetical protein
MKFDVRRNLLVLPGIAILIFYLVSFTRIGFTSDDESATFTSRFLHGNSILEASKALAEGTGRFYQEIFFTLSQIPYLVPKDQLLLSIGLNRSLQVVFFMVSVSWFVMQVFDSKIFILTFSLMIFTIDLGGWYNAFLSYPLWLSYGFAATFLSAGLLSSYLKKPRKLIAVLFLFVSLFSLLSYESHLFDLVLYLFVLLKQADFQIQNFVSYLKKSRNLIIVYVTFLFIYLITYWSFKSKFGGNYSGSEIGSLEPGTVIGTLLRESFRHSSIKYALSKPLYGMNIDPLNQIQVLFGGVTTALLVLIFIMVFLKLISRKSTKREIDSPSSQVIFTEIGCLLLVFVSPSILLALSTKYQDSRDISAYTTSLQSFVLLNIILAIYLTYGLRLLSKKVKFLSWPSLTYFSSILLVFVLSSASIVQTSLNIKFLNEQVRNTQVWGLLKTNYLKIQSSQQGQEIRSASISRITRSGDYQFWGYFLDVKDRNFLLEPSDEKYPYRVEAILTDCGYILLQTMNETVVNIYTSKDCDPKILFMKTSSFEFSSDYVNHIKITLEDRFSFK